MIRERQREWASPWPSSVARTGAARKPLSDEQAATLRQRSGDRRVQGAACPRVQHQPGNSLPVPPHGRLTHAASFDPLCHGAGHLLALPESQDDLIRYYTFNDSDLSLIRQRRGDANRLGFAVTLPRCATPGYALSTDSELPPEPVILWAAKQIQADPTSWAKYGERDVTRREHALELRTFRNQPLRSAVRLPRPGA